MTINTVKVVVTRPSSMMVIKTIFMMVTSTTYTAIMCTIIL